MIVAAAHESAIERLAGLAVVALPAAALDALRERLVGRDERTVHVQIFVAGGVGVARAEAGARQEGKGRAQENWPAPALEHQLSPALSESVSLFECHGTGTSASVEFVGP